MRMIGKWKSMRTKIKCVEVRIENRKRLLVDGRYMMRVKARKMDAGPF